MVQVERELELLGKSTVEKLLNPLAIIPALTTIAVLAYAQFASSYSGVDWWLTIMGILLCGEAGRLLNFRKQLRKGQKN